MPVYIGDTEITAAYNGASAASAIYLGSDKVWPVITFPYTVINSDVTGAAIPPGATGAWIELWGKGANGGGGGYDSTTQSSGHAAGGNGGGGGAHVKEIFVYVEDMGSTWDLIFSPTISRFVSGAVDLRAGAASGTSGGTAFQAGLTAEYYSVEAINGAARGANSNGAGAGGANGGDSDWTGDNAPNTSPPGTRGTGSNGGTNGGTGGTAYGAGNSLHTAAGGGGGGGGGYTAGQNGSPGTSRSGGVGGSGGSARARIQWVNTFVPKKKAYPVITTAGAWSWTCPTWMRNGDKVDIAICGAGKGGNKGTSTSAGAGGRAGTYQGITLTVGVHVNPGGTISGVIGTGGAANGGNGGNTTCVYTGGTLTALGATGVLGSVATNGETRADFVFNGRTYPGGAGGSYNALMAGSPGSAPGGGGGPGGSVFFAGQNGAAGGNGGVNIYAYQV